MSGVPVIYECRIMDGVKGGCYTKFPNFVSLCWNLWLPLGIIYDFAWQTKSIGILLRSSGLRRAVCAVFLLPVIEIIRCDTHRSGSVSFFGMVPAASMKDVEQGFQYADDIVSFIQHNAFAVGGISSIGNF